LDYITLNYGLPPGAPPCPDPPVPGGLPLPVALLPPPAPPPSATDPPDPAKPPLVLPPDPGQETPPPPEPWVLIVDQMFYKSYLR
jgi:hypothetical protein